MGFRRGLVNAGSVTYTSVMSLFLILALFLLASPELEELSRQAKRAAEVNHDEALRLNSLGIRRSEMAGSIRYQTLFMTSLAMLLKDRREGVALAGKALVLAEKAGDEDGRAGAHRILCQLKFLGRLPGAHAHCAAAAKIYRDLGSPFEADARSSLGTILGLEGRFSEAIAEYVLVLGLSENTRAYNSLGNTYRLAGRYEEARSYAKRALDRALTEDAPLDVCLAFTTAASAHAGLGEEERAMELHSGALKLCEKAGSTHLSDHNLKLALLELKRGRKKDGLARLAKGGRFGKVHRLFLDGKHAQALALIRSWKEAPNFDHKSAALIARGLAQEKTGDLAAARRSFQEAADLIAAAEKTMPEDWRKGFRAAVDYGFARSEAFAGLKRLESRSNASK